jgi:hypothetical protein
MDAIMNIEGFRALGSDVFETVVNKSEKVKDTKKRRARTWTRRRRRSSPRRRRSTSPSGSRSRRS